MASATPQSSDTRDWVEICEEREAYAFRRLFRVIEAKLRHRRFDGEMGGLITRINFERGDSVGVLLYDPAGDAVVLVRQFRYPVYAGLGSEERSGEGARKAWILETVAGMVDPGSSERQVAHKELFEEAGIVLHGELRPIATIYPSPGGTSERIHLFLAEVDARRRQERGGGVAAEGEDIQIVVVPLSEAMDRIARGEICDAKTIIALQHLALNPRRVA